MLEKLLRHLRNWFVVPNGIQTGKFTIEGGSITLPFLLKGQYFRIVGSVLNDGVYKYPAATLKNETFTGAIWPLAVPAEIIELAEEISEWNEKNTISPYTSESFGGYSYTRATNGESGLAVTWQDAFRSRLNPWRKL